MQPLEGRKNCRSILRIESDAIVSNGNDPFPACLFSEDVDFRRLIGLAIFQSVSYQILEQPHHLSAVHFNGRQGIVGDTGAAFLDCLGEVSEGRLQVFIEGDRCGALLFGSGAGVFKQVLYQRTHALRGADDET